MPDLTLDEFSGLKEEEIKIRLLEDYNTIYYKSSMRDDIAGTSKVSQRNIKKAWHNIKIHIITQFKSILFKRKVFSK